MYAENELSEWFDLSEQKPWELGVYEVNAWVAFDGEMHSYWDGKKFNAVSFTGPERAYQMRWLPPLQGVSRWRGLSYDPALPKKLARKSDPDTSHDAATKLVKSGAQKSHCDRIRACLVKHGRMTPSEIAEKLKIRRSSVFRRMSDLKKEGKASRTGEKRGGQSVWNAI